MLNLRKRGEGAKIRVSCRVRALSKALCVLHLIREFVSVCVCMRRERKEERDREGERDGMNVFCQT